MTTVFALFIGAFGAIWIYKRVQAKANANFQARVLASFTGVWPVFPNNPWDETVDERARNIANGFIEQGNQFPKYVQPYYYNDMLVGDDGKPKSTASLDWQNCLVLFCHDYLRRVQEFHEQQHAKDPAATIEHLAYQRKSPN